MSVNMFVRNLRSFYHFFVPGASIFIHMLHPRLFLCKYIPVMFLTKVYLLW